MEQQRPSLKKIGYWSFLSLAVVGFGIGILCFPTETAGGVSSGMALCLTTLIPSTFPFVVLSAFCVYSGVSNLLGKLLGPLTRLLFYLPGCCGAVILLGWLGGYPTGARGVVSLYRHGSITQKQAERLLWFSVNAGPSFTISVIGGGLYGSVSFGVLLFCCQTGALLLMGIVSGIVCRIREKNQPLSTATPEPPQAALFSDALVLAANDGARGAANLCSFVMVFNALIEPLYGSGLLQWFCTVLQKLGLSFPAASSLFPLIWEITSGMNYASWVGAPLGLIVFLTAFGGLCVLGQITATASPLHISKVKFILSRVIHGGLSLLLFTICKGFCFLPTPADSVFHNTSEMVGSSISLSGTTTMASIVCGTLLLILCAVFLLCKKGNRLAKPQ